jgi:hypothetical protein
VWVCRGWFHRRRAAQPNSAALQTWKNLIKKADKDGNGKIDHTEFCELPETAEATTSHDQGDDPR